MVYIDQNGNSSDPPIQGEAQNSDQISASADYVVEHTFRAGTVPVRQLADHAPANYLRAFWN